MGAQLTRGGAALDILREPGTIRARCAAITRAVSEGRSPHFRIDRARLDDAARRVSTLMDERFPDGRIPLHSRWRHFEAGGIDRKSELDVLTMSRSVADRARAQIDVAVVSVLLDAGAGAQWRYRDDGANSRGGADGAPSFARSEGLGVASWRAFMAGVFSADAAGDPCRADAPTLQRFDAAVLRTAFQVSASNPLVGLEGRAGLITRLGEALAMQAQRDGLAARPGSLYDRLTDAGRRTEVSAAALLADLLRVLAPVWRGGPTISGQSTGDCWPHRWAGMDTGSESGKGEPHPITMGWVPFHKLTQWLAYSLVEPLQWAGVTVSGLDALTGLPEYRNGGLLIDAGVIVPRSSEDLRRTWKPSDEFVIEWRALTVTLIDELADRLRVLRGVDAQALPLGNILEGGTWAAGRAIASELRPGGAPPLTIESDGTVF